jgi:glutamine---fructose-6-phosphate transaminase (isomerizing)
MCGIVGYVGHSQACTILLNGLKRLEYRGYDSAGIAVSNNRNVVVSKTKGKIHVLEEEMKHFLPEGRLGVGHTRWATHGRPSETNAHPHRAGRVVVVHNGIIENYLLLKNSLIASGRTFRSETDSEVIAQLLDHHLEQGMRPLEAIRKICAQLKGSFATAILIADDKKTL